jgi:hypothetical protein
VLAGVSFSGASSFWAVALVLLAMRFSWVPGVNTRRPVLIRSDAEKGQRTTRATRLESRPECEPSRLSSD